MMRNSALLATQIWLLVIASLAIVVIGIVANTLRNALLHAMKGLMAMTVMEIHVPPKLYQSTLSNMSIETRIPIRHAFRLPLLLLGAMLLQTGLPQAGKSPQQARRTTYYDARERIATTLTFEWNAVSTITLSKEFITSHNAWLINHVELGNKELREELERDGIPPEEIQKYLISADELQKRLVPEEAAEHPVELSKRYLIERTPKRTRVRCQQQILSLAEGMPSAELEQYDTYFQGSMVITVGYSDGRPRDAAISEAEKDVWAFADSTGTVRTIELVFLAGISPLRLEGAELEQWHLKSVSPEKWVFTLKRAEDEEEPVIEVELDRRYQDAPARVEVRYSNGDKWIWRVLKYKRIERVWFPSEVECVANTGLGLEWEKYILVRSERTKSVEFEIPEGLPVTDMRRVSDSDWESYQTGNIVIKVLTPKSQQTWKPDLLEEKREKK